MGQGANVSGVDVSGRDVAGFDLEGTTFENSDLSGVIFTGAHLSSAVLNGALLDYVEGKSLQACPSTLPELWTCTANHLVGPTAILNQVDLSGEDFSARYLPSVNWSGSNLNGVDFSNCDLSYGVLEGSNLNNATLRMRRAERGWTQSRELPECASDGLVLSC